MNRHAYYGLSSRAENTGLTFARTRSDAAFVELERLPLLRTWAADIVAGILLVGFMVSIWLALPSIAAVL